MRQIYKAAIAAIIGLSMSTATQAGQQQWASQYVQWNFDGNVNEVWNIDQQVWIPIPANKSYWPIQWNFNGQNYGGYMGLQQAGSASTQNVRFSIWNATAAEGSDCEPFGGEGVGQTCKLPVTIDTAKFYRLRLWRLDSENNGQWWGGWLIEADAGGTLTEHYIGKILAPAAATSVNPNSITNFVEYWGDEVPQCQDVPMSVVGLTPPAVNYHGKGTGVYSGYSTYAGSQKAPDNRCQTGTENNGALITAQPYNFGFAQGILMFLGGTSSEHVLNSSQHPTPPDMPDS